MAGVVEAFSEALIIGAVAINGGLSVRECHVDKLVFNYPGHTYSLGTKTNRVKQQKALVNIKKSEIVHGGYIDASK
jgi:hypothetical protein